MAVWNGATADVTVSGNSVTAASINQGGSAYSAGTYYLDSSSVADGGIGGGGPDARLVIGAAGISTATGNYIQVTGISTGTDSYHRISAVNTTKQITVSKTASDLILDGQQIIDLGPWVSVGSASFSSTVTTFNTTVAHGLVVGNKFRVLNASDASLGDFIVASVPDVDTFTAVTTTALTSPKYILKHGLSDNEALSSKAGENLGVRGLSIFDHETLKLNELISSSDSAFRVTLPDGTTTATSIVSRFPLGSYIEIDGEIMRIASSSLSGGAGDEISVIRGALGTISSTHPANSKIKKIKPIPVELRRPSILRASGHTFEYVGYGPGNYSTALPQLQNRSLSEREEFLTQSQETSCGNVVYTGMNDKGDFYIGNTKIASASGQQTTFDIPIPTVTGEDPNRLSIVADEVVVKERLLVEGGTSKQILSQFDGPVTFNENVRLANPNKKLDVTGNVNIADTGQLNVNNTTNSTSTITGAVVIDGGVGIAKSMHIGGDIVGSGSDNIVGFASITASTFYGDGSGLSNTGAQLSESTSAPFASEERVVLTNVTTGTMITAKTDNNLKFNFETNTLSCTNFTGALSGNSTTSTTATNIVGASNRVIFNSGTDTTTTSANFTYDATQLRVQGNVRANNITLGLTDGTTINTTTGDLKLNSSNNKVDITNNCDIGGRLVIDGSDPVSINNVTKDNAAVVIQNGSLGVEGKIVAGNDIIAFNSSDLNLKENLAQITNAVQKVGLITGYTYDWKETVFENSINTGISSTLQDTYLDEVLDVDDKADDTGVIAQDVEKLGLPGVTITRPDGIKAVRYERLIPVLIEAIKELSARVAALESS